MANVQASCVGVRPVKAGPSRDPRASLGLPSARGRPELPTGHPEPQALLTGAPTSCKWGAHSLGSLQNMMQESIFGPQASKVRKTGLGTCGLSPRPSSLKAFSGLQEKTG